MLNIFNCHDSYHVESKLSLLIYLPVAHADSGENGGHCGRAHCEGG